MTIFYSIVVGLGCLFAIIFIAGIIKERKKK